MALLGHIIWIVSNIFFEYWCNPSNDNLFLDNRVRNSEKKQVLHLGKEKKVNLVSIFEEFDTAKGRSWIM